MLENILIERAREEDRAAILAVMRPWNMHHVPSVEMESMELANYFVARLEGKVIGAAGYALLSQTVGKTTLLGVLPEYNRSGVGKALQQRRLETLHRLGVKTVITNSDRPATIKWLTESYGFRPVGTLKKLMSFGDPEIDHWTTLELDLAAYMQRAERETIRREHIARHEPHPLAPYPPLLIHAALRGEDSVAATSEAALTVAQAGAQIVQIDFTAAAQPRIITEVIGRIRRQRPETILGVKMGPEWLVQWLASTTEDRPDLACLTLGSLNLPSGPCINSTESICQAAEVLRNAGIGMVLEIYDLGMIGLAHHLDREGLLPAPKYFNFILGNPGTAPATIGALAGMIAALPERSVWCAEGMGIFQTSICGAALVAGGGMRLAIDKNSQNTCGNEEKAILAPIRRAVRLANELERPLATADQARAMLGLPPAL